jgi:hypothetical protein
MDTTALRRARFLASGMGAREANSEPSGMGAREANSEPSGMGAREANSEPSEGRSDSVVCGTDTGVGGHSVCPERTSEEKTGIQMFAQYVQNLFKGRESLFCFAECNVGLENKKNPVGGEIFRTCPDRPWGLPSLLYNGYQGFPGAKERPGRDADPLPPSSAVGQERVELYLYSPYGPYGLYRVSVPVQG